MNRWTTAYAVVALVAMGCGSCGGTQNGDGEGASESASSGGPAMGVVEGVVRLAPNAELPSYPPVRHERQPAPPESCAPPRVDDRQPVRLGEGRGLEGVLVAGAEFDTTVPHEPAPREVAIRDCRLTPMFVAATRGDTLVVKNETEYPFMPIVGEGGLAQALLNGQTKSHPLDQGGVRTVTCTFAAPCGRADVVVLYHPVHTLTGEAGRFRLEVPAGEELEVHAWHPLFQEASETLTLEPGETRRVELVLDPAPVPEQPAAEAPTGDEVEAGEGAESTEPAGETTGEGEQPEDGETLF